MNLDSSNKYSCHKNAGIQGLGDSSFDKPLILKKTSVLKATPPCGREDEITPSSVEGPYFKPNSPRRNSLLELGKEGDKLTVTGCVFSTDSEPVKEVLLDFWQADINGNYDEVGYNLRGHQFSNDKGQYFLETIVPGEYPGRTRHLHVKVQAPNKPVLTTQLYFPGEVRNEKDLFFNDDLLMDIYKNSDGSINATFNFVLCLKKNH